MLNLLRKKKITKRILWALAIIIVPAFVFWGAGSLSKRKFPYGYIGTIEGKRVSLEEFIKSAKDVRIGLFLNYFNQPQALDGVQKDRKLINRLAWQNLIIKSGARKDNVTVSDKEVVGFITKHPLFTEDGIFNERLYKYILKNSLRIMPRAFEENVRSFLLNAKYRADIVGSVTVSDDELLQVYKKEFEKARVYYIVIDKGSFKDTLDVALYEITSYYQKNKMRFREPEKVILQYIAFPHKEEGAKEKALADLRSCYGKLKSRPHEMEKTARDLNLAIKETPPFSKDELVPQIGDIKQMGIISFRLRPLVDILPVANENEIGTSYIVRVKEKISPRPKSKSEVSSYIEGILKNEKALALAKEETDRLYGEAKVNNMSLEKIAKKYHLGLNQTALISRFDYIEGVGESYKIVENAFGLKMGEVSKPVEVRKGFALIEPAEFLFIDEEKFEDEKENYNNKVLSAKKIKALEDWFEKARSESPLNVNLDEI